MYHYTSCGLPNVYLSNGYTIRETAYGEAVAIHNIKELHESIGLSICEMPEGFSKEELRYLRSELDMSQKCLAELLGVSEVAYRKWESNVGKANISRPAERLLRLYYRESVVGDRAIKDALSEIAKMDKKNHPSNMQFEESDGEWTRKIAS